MPTRPEVDTEKDYYSSRISETSRFVGFGLLASYYALTVSPPDAFQVNDYLLVGVGLFGALAVFFDYFQYVTGYAMTRAALRAGDPYSYDKGWAVAFFGLKTISFWLKQLFAGLGALGLIALIWCAQN